MSQGVFKIGSLVTLGVGATASVIVQVIILAPRISPLVIAVSVAACIIVWAAIYVPLEGRLIRSQRETQLPPIGRWIVDPGAPDGFREASTRTVRVLQERADEIEGRK